MKRDSPFSSGEADVWVELRIGEVAVPVELNGSAAARALAARIPQELSMSVSSVGCCGQLPFSLPHDEADVHPGWCDGDLNYKPEGDWLALFFDDEKNSARYGGQVTLGHAVGPLDALQGQARTCKALIQKGTDPF